MDTAKASNPEDVYEFKSVKESESSPEQKSSDPLEMDVECNEGGSQSIQVNLIFYYHKFSQLYYFYILIIG